MSERHTRAERRGRWAEHVALLRLRCAGYALVERNYRVSWGEIDLIVRRGRVLAFVEVKIRADADTAAYAIVAAQQTRIRNAAAAFLARRPELADLDLRFDAVLVSPWRLPLHLRDAWRDSP
jgi:putative endonuclease